jgi:hypothetical protein
MVFETPIWLWGLLPWTAVVVYLFTGHGRVTNVPFLRFWKSSATVAPRRAFRLPPIFIWLVLIALLLTILAGAGPALHIAAKSLSGVTIVLDCGSTMARPAVDGKPFRNAIDRCSKQLGQFAGRVSIFPVPGDQKECAGDDWQTTASRIPLTAMAVDLHQTVLDRLRQTTGPVVVLSDQQLNMSNARLMPRLIPRLIPRLTPRLIQISPDPPAPAVAITLLAAVAQPRPQVMVRLENHSVKTTVRLRITSGKASIDRQISLKPATQSQDEFFDLPGVDQIISAEIIDADPNDPWHKAYLVRQSSGVRVVGVGELPESVVRMIAVYTRDRPAAGDAPALLVSDHALNDQQTGIWIDQTGAVAASSSSTPMVAASPITTDVQSWPGSAGQTMAVPADFVPVVWIDGSAVVAVRDQPSRQILVRGDFKTWEKTPDFVVFFANAFGWLAGNQSQYAAISPAALGQGWSSTDASHAPGTWPGVYRSDTGSITAVNAGTYPSEPLANDNATDNKTTTRTNPLPTTTSDTSLTAAVICVALGCLLLAAFVWPGG